MDCKCCFIGNFFSGGQEGKTPNVVTFIGLFSRLITSVKCNVFIYSPIKVQNKHK